MNLTASAAAPLFSTLGNERRLRVVLALLDCVGGASPSVLSPILDIPEPQLSDLLADLLKHGLVSRARAGRHVLFRLNTQLLTQLATLIAPGE